MAVKTYRVHILVILSIIGYTVIGYFTRRKNYELLFTAYFLLFALYFFLNNLEPKSSSFNILIGSAFLFRLLLLFSWPALSDDFYRFVWDGQLLSHGLNPYSHLPAEIYPGLTSGIPLSDVIYSHLNTLQRSNYTCYPPLHELFFYLSAILFPKSLFGNVLIMRLFILAAEAGTVFFGIKALRLLQKPVNNILFYALNPLIIIELTGNLHFEAVMIFFFVLGLYWWIKNRNHLSSFALGMSVSVKLITLLVFPYFLFKFGLKKKIIFILLFLTAIILLFLPLFLSVGQAGFFKSIALYFHNFEFNAGILNLFRQSILMISGLDLVVVFGPVLLVISTLLMLAIYLFRNNNLPEVALESMLFAITVFYFFATTVHPWYLSTLVVLSVFTRFRYPIVWSMVVILSYYAYRYEEFSENFLLIFIEYAVVFLYYTFELFGWQKKLFGKTG